MISRRLAITYTALSENTYLTTLRDTALIIYRDIITRPFHLFARLSLRKLGRRRLIYTYISRRLREEE